MKNKQKQMTSKEENIERKIEEPREKQVKAFNLSNKQESAEDVITNISSRREITDEAKLISKFDKKVIS